MTVVPGLIYWVIIGIRVFLLLSGTTTMKDSLLPRSIPPNTQWPSTLRPWWYLRFPNLDSSISTILPGPPMEIGWSRKYCPQTSRKKLYQSIVTVSVTSKLRWSTRGSYPLNYFDVVSCSLHGTSLFVHQTKIITSMFCRPCECTPFYSIPRRRKRGVRSERIGMEMFTFYWHVL